VNRHPEDEMTPPNSTQSPRPAGRSPRRAARQPNICVLGPGNMGRIIVQRLIHEKFAEPRRFAVSKTRTPDQLIAQFPGVRVLDSNPDAVRDADIVLLAIKPQMFPEVAQEIRSSLRARQLVVSVMTGIDIAAMARLLNHKKTVRCSTNIAIEVGRAVTFWTAEACDDADLLLARQMFASWGREVFTQQERHLDITIVGVGSAPAFMAYIIWGMIRSLVHLGLPADLAKTATFGVTEGTLALVELEPDRHLADFIDEVTTPGGITARGLHKFDAGLFAMLTEAYEAAYNKVIEFKRSVE
jgi:pyrroline-5-carboxylate reductase